MTSAADRTQTGHRRPGGTRALPPRTRVRADVAHMSGCAMRCRYGYSRNEGGNRRRSGHNSLDIVEQAKARSGATAIFVPIEESVTSHSFERTGIMAAVAARIGKAGLSISFSRVVRLSVVARPEAVGYPRLSPFPLQCRPSTQRRCARYESLGPAFPAT